MSSSRPTYQGHILMLVANMLWGLMAPISKDSLSYFAEHDISAFTLAAFRMIGAAISFWILSAFLPTEKTTRSDRGKLFIAGMLSIVFNQCLFIVGISFTTPIDASVVTTMLPIATMILAAIVLHEPITGLKAIGVLLGMAGAVLLILGNGQGLSLERDNLIGDMMCLIAQFSFATYLVFFKNFIGRFAPVTLMKWMFLWSAIVIVPFAAPSIMSIDYSAMPVKVILEICYTVFIGTFFTYMLVPTAQKVLRPTVVSMYNYVQPVMSTAVSLLWGMTTFGLVKGIVIGLVFAGVYIVTQSKSRKQMEAEKLQNTKA
ncbi:MAG: DMT family transporter [Bacteroidales bacterium]|nr:DMT family transporter [Bacteroidales bacterium]